MARFTARARLARLSMVLSILAALLIPAASASAAGIGNYCVSIICANPGPTVTDLDAGSTVVTYPAAINNNGKVAGRMYGASFGWHAFAWQAGARTDLGALATVSPRASLATGINQAGDIVGMSESNLYTNSAFLYRNGVMSLVFPNAAAMGINSSSQIAGYVKNTAGVHQAVVFQNGTIQFASTVTGCPYTEGHAINDNGVMAITALCTNTHLHASTWHNGTLTDLGAPYQGDSSTNGINGAGEVVGDWTQSGFTMGVEWTKGAIYGLYPLPGQASSSAAAINSTGRVAGYSRDTAGRQHAVAWSGFAVQDLTAQLSPSSGWVLEYATGINDYGQIVGEGLHNGVEHGFLFTPAAQLVLHP